MLEIEELILLSWWLIIQSLLYNTCLLICDIHLGQNLLDKCINAKFEYLLSVQRKFISFWRAKGGKIVHTACHNDSSSMNLMFLTPYIKLIGHSQETCVLWINCSQNPFEKETLLFLLCGVASFILTTWQSVE